MKSRTGVLSAAILLLASLIALAAARFEVKCSQEDCDFNITYFNPNSFSTRAVNGYCVHCKTIVTVKTHAAEEDARRREMKKRGIDVSHLPPITKELKPKFTVWDPKTGQTRELYECRRCKNLFFPYDFKFCPKCKRPSLKTQQVGDHYD